MPSSYFSSFFELFFKNETKIQREYEKKGREKIGYIKAGLGLV